MLGGCQPASHPKCGEWGGTPRPEALINHLSVEARLSHITVLWAETAA